MTARLPLGPFDNCLRQPIGFKCEIEGGRISAVSVHYGRGRRGIRLGFEGLSPVEGLRLAARICARSCVAHSTAYCQALEAALGIEVEAGASAFRAIVAEYERIASHMGIVSDIGRALCDDAVYRGPRRYVERIRSAFEEASGDPFGMGLVVPGGAAIPRDARALRELSETWKAIERDCGFWGRKLGLSRARLKGASLPADSIGDDTPPAPALRAAGMARDTRSGENAYGYYSNHHYRPVVREGGTAFDRTLQLLDEVRASIGIIRVIGEAEGISPGARPDVEYHNGNGVGVCESPEGAVEHKVFLNAEGRLIRDAVSSAVWIVAGLAAESLEGARFEDIAPAVISLYLCAPCLDLRVGGHDVRHRVGLVPAPAGSQREV